MRTITRIAITSTALALSAGCTGQLPNGFRLQQQLQSFGANIQVNTKIDMLWVVDNSPSMDVEQQRLRNGFAAFAQQYMQPTWDIRMAVITSDTYLANPAYAAWRNTTIPGTTGYKSPYINGRLGTFVNPPSNPNLVNLSTGAMDNGVRYVDLVPAWGENFGRLLPGLHDGPIAGLCFEGLPYLLWGQTQCPIRDNQANYSGPSHCLNPNASAGETSVTQCVNTLENDTIHSGTAIISTMPPAGVAADSAWTQQLINNFTINVTTGTSGFGSERGMQSMLEMIQDNESTSTALFRPGSTRAIIFLSDEDDQTMVPPTTAPSGFGPWTHYACDQVSLTAANGASVSQNGGFCCSDGTCEFGAEGTSCASKTVDSYTYTIGICPVAADLMPVSQVKSQLDAFFTNLDASAGATGITGITGASGSNPNYFVTSIVALSGSGLQSIDAARAQDDANAKAIRMVAADRGDRYIALGNLVGNGSLSMDLSQTDYSPILNAIGQAIIQQKSTFTVARPPTGTENLIMTVVHANGTKTVIPSSDIAINGNQITITDYSIVLGFKSTDQISISYQPATVY